MANDLAQMLDDAAKAIQKAYEMGGSHVWLFAATAALAAAKVPELLA